MFFVILNASSKLPRLILPPVYRFAPNRDILGGTAYLILHPAGNLLVDCPPWNTENQAFINQQGGVRWLFLTHRGGISKDIGTIQKTLQCELVIQEQEAYLLPGLPVTCFHQAWQPTPDLQALWTPGHSPGSACLYDCRQGGILFTGRHLLPDTEGQPRPLRLAKTFHWPRQLAQVTRLLEQFSSDTLEHICPGANSGFLRGRDTIANAYQALIDSNALGALAGGS